MEHDNYQPNHKGANRCQNKSKSKSIEVESTLENNEILSASQQLVLEAFLGNRKSHKEWTTSLNSKSKLSCTCWIQNLNWIPCWKWKSNLSSMSEYENKIGFGFKTQIFFIRFVHYVHWNSWCSLKSILIFTWINVVIQ